MNKWSRKLHPLESVLMLVMAGVLLCLCVGRADQQRLAAQVVRLHVLANSDSDEDQALKLQVRNAVLAQAQPLLEAAADRDSAEEILSAHLADFDAAAQAVVNRAGRPYCVHTQLTTRYFPTKEYADFSLPAGEYRALRVEIGDARGHNWWCVVYPPLCTAGVTETEPASLGLGEDEVSLITQDSTEFILRFQCVEWWSQIREAVTAD